MWSEVEKRRSVGVEGDRFRIEEGEGMGEERARRKSSGPYSVESPPVRKLFIRSFI